MLINDIKARGGGRTYAGLPGNWGAQYEIGQVPVYEYLADHSVDEVGFVLRTPSLVADNEAYFNQNDPAQYQLYNVRYILMPSGMQPPVPATLILASSGRHRLWLVATTGYLQVVDTAGDRRGGPQPTWRSQMQPFSAFGDRSAQGELATVAYDGGAAATPTLPIGATPSTPAGTSTDVLVQAAERFLRGRGDREPDGGGGAQGDLRSALARDRGRDGGGSVHGGPWFCGRHRRARAAHRGLPVRRVLALPAAARHRRT